MRTFKFRVWNKKTNSWVEGCERSDIPCLDGVNLLGETILLGAFMNEVSIEDLNDCIAVQFTGLFDQSGKCIYEGDIIQNQSGRRFIVEWVYKGFEYKEIINKDGINYISNCYCNFIGNESLCQVMGNIFENPELLK